jgi:hypothetical protein
MSEIKTHLSDRLIIDRDISDYNVEVADDGAYCITISLVKFNRQEARKVFMSLCSFLCIQEIVCFARDIKNNSINYLLIAGNKDYNGYLCKIEFKSS